MGNIETRWVVYCGVNGKYYTFKNKEKAQKLQSQMFYRNFYTELREIKVQVKKQEIVNSEQIKLKI